VGYPPALAAKQKITLPVVAFAAGDPVATGLVESLARPGGNITGISDVSAELTPKRMGFLKQMVPALGRWRICGCCVTMKGCALFSNSRKCRAATPPAIGCGAWA
jgi:hypothetical protein